MHLGALAGGLGCFPLDHGPYHPQSDCYGVFQTGIRSLIPFSTPGWGHHEFSALPPVSFHNASPKAISGRTSYFRVRLEFLP